MVYTGGEGELGGLEGVVGWEVYIEEKYTTYNRGEREMRDYLENL